MFWEILNKRMIAHVMERSENVQHHLLPVSLIHNLGGFEVVQEG